MTTCHGGCENNGTCSVKNQTCICPRGFTGKRCEQVTCTPECQNEGICVRVDGVGQCRCPMAFNGTRCEQAVCKEDCMNGGSCQAVGTRSHCLCPRGFFGERCQNSIKEGDCPVVASGNCTSQRRCQFDQDCQGREKCCGPFPGCGIKACVPPARHGCPYNDRVYPVGSQFHANPCKVCRCLVPDPNAPYGGATCTDVKCPTIPEGYLRCKRQARGDNQCCKVCKEPEIKKPPNCTVPVFKNCPEEGSTLDLPTRGHTVRVPQKLEAIDMRGRKLDVEYSSLNLTWSNNIDRNIHLISATAMDEWEQVIECSFIVRIRDPHPPVFTSCPDDVGPEEGPTVSWVSPKASDNIGLAGPPESDHQPGQAFPTGQTLVTYTAEDLEGNEEVCQFIVLVEPNPTAPSREARVFDSVPAGKYVRIYLPLGLGFLVLLLLLVIVVCCLKRRRHNASQEVKCPVKVDAPPSYTAAMKESSSLPSKDATTQNYEYMAPPTDSFDNPAYSVGEPPAYSVVESAR